MKAIALISGGLDSVLAAKIVKDQGIFVIGVYVKTSFTKGEEHALMSAAHIGIPLIIVHAEDDFLRVVRNPKFGYGTEMNPCIDCRIFMLKKAKEIAERVGADFVVTGEVLDERPMSQHWRALKLTTEEAGLKGLVLRPLSAKLLPKTIPEIEGWVNRKSLFAIRGRSRKMQLALAQRFGIPLSIVSSPAGGCLLTNKEFAAKLKDLFAHKSRVSVSDVERLKVGRHFRFRQFKIIVGRNEEENKKLRLMKRQTDVTIEVPHVGSPITLLEIPESLSENVFNAMNFGGSEEHVENVEGAREGGACADVNADVKSALEIAARITARYSDARDEQRVKVVLRYGNIEKFCVVQPARDEDIGKLRIY